MRVRILALALEGEGTDSTTFTNIMKYRTRIETQELFGFNVKPS